MMWKRPERYPLQSPLKVIDNPLMPAEGIRLLIEIEDSSVPGEHYLFFDNHGGLSIVRGYGPSDSPGCIYEQNDFPLAFLDWFAPAVRHFRRPAGSGSLRGLSTSPQAVGGEMLTLERGMAVGGDDMPGYIVNNWSRKRSLAGLQEHFMPMNVAWTEAFLFSGGLLRLISYVRSRI